MKNKDLVFDSEARKELMKGITVLSKAVSSTLGPAGQNVVIENEHGTSYITKDGVTVAKAIKLKDPVQNIGAQILKEAANQTANEAGDGTTTSTVLARDMITSGLKYISSGANPIELKRGMDIALVNVLELLKTNTKEIGGKEEIEQIGTVSANNDKEVGKLISEAMDRVGIEGVITVEDGKGFESSLELVEGVQFDRGYLSPYFVTNNELMISQLQNPYILLYDKKIGTAKQIIPILEQIMKDQKPLLIIAEDIIGEALATLLVNKSRGSISVCAVKAPGFGSSRIDYLEDIASMTGAEVVSIDKGMKLEKITIDVLGSARSISISGKQTTIIDGAGTEEKITKRLIEVKALADNAVSDFEREGLQHRIATMTGGVAIINIGAQTELELNEKKDRVEDALHATRAAVEEGIIPGGGVALMNVKEDMILDGIEFENEDQKLGGQLLLNSLDAPFNTIIENAGWTGEAIWERIKTKRKDNQNIGINVRDNEIVDLVEAGIIDPMKVARVALEKAVSVSGNMLITNAVISIDPEDKSTDEQLHAF